MTYSKLKRVYDCVCVIVLLIIVWPFFILIPLLIKMEDRSGPVIYTQERIGKDGIPFILYKFRSMRQLDPLKELESDGERLLRVGRLIRKTSLDELPQLFNVLRGEMSLIGPRPLLPEYLSFYTEQEKKRHNVRPGMSGLAQCKGRHTLNWEERFDLDVYYVENLSFRLDLLILALTIKRVCLIKDVMELEANPLNDLVDERKPLG